jgi:hypothetical protein
MIIIFAHYREINGPYHINITGLIELNRYRRGKRVVCCGIFAVEKQRKSFRIVKFFNQDRRNHGSGVVCDLEQTSAITAIRRQYVFLVHIIWKWRPFLAYIVAAAVVPIEV